MPRPIFIQVDGQSNAVNHPSKSWSPASNLQIWNNVIGTVGSVGTSFVSPSSSTISTGTSFADQVARKFSDRTVLLCNTGIGGTELTDWAPAGDCYYVRRANQLAALVAAGVTRPSIEAWWQGESEANSGASATYGVGFEALRTRLITDGLSTLYTPLILCGVSAYVASRYIDFNLALEVTTRSDPLHRRYVDTSSVGSSLWDPATSNIHMLANGYVAVGPLLFDAYMDWYYAQPHPVGVD